MRKLTISLICFFILVACRKDYHYIEIKSPGSDTVLSGFVVIEIELNGPDYSNRVDYLMNDSLISTLILPNYTYTLNTYSFPDTNEYQLVVELSDYKNEFLDSDTILFAIDNRNILYAEDFEYCTTYSYPFYHGWYEIWPGDFPNGAYITEENVYEGFHSFKQIGVSDTARTDAIRLLLSNADAIMYELMVMIPDNSNTGAYIGFWCWLGPSLGTIYNGVLFNQSDHRVQIRGVDILPTDYEWLDSTWYNVRVGIDYKAEIADFWINDSLIAGNIPAAQKSISHSFTLSTVHGAPGSVYFDNIIITHDSL